MQVVRVDVYGYDLTYVHGTYVMSGGREIVSLPSTVVRVTADDGTEGFGETLPARARLPAGARRGRARRAARARPGAARARSARARDRRRRARRGAARPRLRQERARRRLLGSARQGDGPAGLRPARRPPAGVLPALRRGPARAAPRRWPRTCSARRAEGIHHFQLKLGADPHDDATRVRAVLDATTDEDVVIADANGGWRLQDAVVAARLLEGLDRVFFEQPCPTLEECLYVRARTTLPMVLDEVITDARRVPARVPRGRHGGDQPQDLQGRRPHARASDPRARRDARHPARRSRTPGAATS